jgi:hypothetical protein
MKTPKIRKKARAATSRSVEIYSEARVREFEQTNTLPDAMQRRVNAVVKKKQAKS